jgi:formylglycine-generating enzyme required for sulfatase activity
VIVLDQFEQWLHASAGRENSELVRALRHCDGVRVQCIVMVRDDFWMAATRFMQELEIRLVEAENSLAVDLFDPRHATKVLSAFGRAFSALPEQANRLSPDQDAFLDQAVNDLAQEGKIISVRLALFAEMVKGKPWTPDTLKSVGGASGVGVTFLDETFSASTAPPEHRYHQKAARAVLKALLPESGSDIKGMMRSREELLVASGYASRPRDFDSLLQILDSELRLITPTELEEVATAAEAVATLSSPSPQSPVPSPRFYQLTHDYLVPSLRDWLTRKQRETRRGRAELRLAERAALWNTKPENRHLPSWWEWLNIRWLTRQRDWTPPQKKMMRRAGRQHVSRGVMLLGLVAAMGLGGYEGFGRIRARALTERLLDANTADVPTIVAEMSGYRRWVASLLRAAYDDAERSNDARRQLHASLGLLPADAGQVGYLRRRLLDAEASEVPVIRDALAPHGEGILEQLWAVAESPPDGRQGQRLRAACALASLGPNDARWRVLSEAVAGDLVAVPSVHLADWMDALRPVRIRLLPALSVIFRDAQRPETERRLAAEILADYAADRPTDLAALLVDAEPAQFAILFPKLRELGQRGIDSLLAELNKQPEPPSTTDASLAFAQRRAGAAIALLRQGEREQIFTALRTADDPEPLTQFVHRCRARGVTAGELLECVKLADTRRQGTTGDARRSDDRVLFGLLLALGEFRLEELPEVFRSALPDQLALWYRHDPSSAIHGACGWLLRHWDHGERAEQVDHTPIPYHSRREWFTLEFRRPSQGLLGPVAPVQSFYITFVVFPAGEHQIGSPPEEADREGDETLHQVRLTRPIAVSDREITWAQYNALDDAGTHNAWEVRIERRLTLQEPVFGVSWHESVSFCRWLTQLAGHAESDQCYADPTALPKDEQGNPKDWPLRLDRRGFRLLTEAEWEAVCRSETRTAYSFGNDVQLLRQYGWFLGNSEKWSHGVGLLRPNPRGLFDMHGNLWEWCHDRYGDYADALDDPFGSKAGSNRVNRGGSWFSDTADCRTASRTRNRPTDPVSNLGFRVALVPFSPSQAEPEKSAAQPGAKAFGAGEGGARAP